MKVLMMLGTKQFKIRVESVSESALMKMSNDIGKLLPAGGWYEWFRTPVNVSQPNGTVVVYLINDLVLPLDILPSLVSQFTAQKEWKVILFEKEDISETLVVPG